MPTAETSPGERPQRWYGQLLRRRNGGSSTKPKLPTTGQGLGPGGMPLAWRRRSQLQPSSAARPSSSSAPPVGSSRSSPGGARTKCRGQGEASEAGCGGTQEAMTCASASASRGPLAALIAAPGCQRPWKVQGGEEDSPGRPGLAEPPSSARRLLPHSNQRRPSPNRDALAAAQRRTGHQARCAVCKFDSEVVLRPSSGWGSAVTASETKMLEIHPCLSLTAVSLDCQLSV